MTEWLNFENICIKIPAECRPRRKDRVRLLPLTVVTTWKRQHSDVMRDVISVDSTLCRIPYVQNLSHKKIRVPRLKSTMLQYIFQKIVGWYYSTLFHVRTKDVAILPDRPPTANAANGSKSTYCCTTCRGNVHGTNFTQWPSYEYIL